MTETALPMFMSVPTFSAIDRVVLVPSENTGASLTLVMLIVTGILSLSPLPSEAMTVTE